MIMRSSLRRKLRHKRQRNSLSFQQLEIRQLMAADSMLTATAPILSVEIPAKMVKSSDGESHMTMTGLHCGHQDPAILALVSDDQATHVSVTSGNWSDPSTWTNGVVPTAGAKVVIGNGQTVTIDGVVSESFKTIRIDGTLRFANDFNTQLKVDTLVSTCNGRLEIGTRANPISNDVTAKLIFADDGEIDRTWDPTLISRGAILMGQTEMAGAQTTDRVSLATQPSQGATMLQLSERVTNWKVGDEIVITGTQGSTSDEVRTISFINGATIGLSQPLQLDHIAPKSSLNVYVANKNRNIEVRSENTEVSRRGHIMFHHTNDVTIDNAGFYGLGRTDKSRDVNDIFFSYQRDQVGNYGSAPITYETTRNPEATNVRGRYVLHFHRGGVDPTSQAASVSGSVIDGGPGWGYVNHSSHVNFSNNIAYGIWGSAYYTEVGDEIGSFDNNIAIRTVSPTNPIDPEDGGINLEAGLDNQQFGISGDGFWLSGNMVSVTNNVSSGNSGHGIIFWNDGVVEEDKGRGTVKVSNITNGHLIPNRESIPVWWAPLAEVANNEISNSTIALLARYMHSDTYLGEGGSSYHTAPPQAYIDTLRPTFDGLKIWGSRNGINFNYSERLTLKNAEIVGIGAQYRYFANNVNTGVGLDMGNMVTRGPGRIENVSIEGFKMGMLAPRNDQWVVDNITLKNTTDMLIEEARSAPRTLTMSNINFGSLEGTAVADDSSNRKNILMQPFDFGLGVGQPYFFLLPDQITLDGQQIYWDIQRANFIPLPEAPDGNPQFQIPQEYVQKTNQQLQNTYGMSFGGNLIPAGAQQVSWIEGGKVGALSAANTNYPQLYDTTAAGEYPDDPPGGPIPELTGNFLKISNGETVILTQGNLNTTDTDTSFAGLTYTASQIQNGSFVHRDSPLTPITSFTHADVLGGVIRFVHDGNGTAPDYSISVSDGNTTTPLSSPTIEFDGEDIDDPAKTIEIGYSGTARGVNHRWTVVELPRSFKNPVVVAGGATRNGSHQGVVRIRNVESNSFEIRFQEWDYLDGFHAHEDIGFFVVEAGRHVLTDGTVLLAGTVQVRNETFSDVEFDSPFSSRPVVFSQVMTLNGGAAVTDRIRNVTNSGFEVQMQEEEAANHRHNEEKMGWVAIERGRASSGKTSLNALADSPFYHGSKHVTFGSLDGTTEPVVLSDMQTRNGSDTATIRHTRQAPQTVWLMVEEERSRDNEIGHTGEMVGVLAFEPGILVAKNESRSSSFARLAGSWSMMNFDTRSSRGIENDHVVSRKNTVSMPALELPEGLSGSSEPVQKSKMERADSMAETSSRKQKQDSLLTKDDAFAQLDMDVI